MVFSSLEFLFWFMPAFLALYFLVPFKYKNLVLLLASLFFYAYGEPAYLLLMVLSIAVNYGLALAMSAQAGWQKKFIFIVSLILNLGTLFVFKYYDFFTENINSCQGYVTIPLLSLTLPVGISFYTFQIISYMADVYREKYGAEKNIINFAVYVSMFPKLTAGPIVNYGDIKSSIGYRKVTMPSVETGTQIFIVGLCFKVLLADNIASLWNDVDTIGPYGINAALAWFASWGYSMQLYFDFFGYSLMAIGLGRIIGFRLPKNFNDPYTAVSLTDFWRRWHMTLSGWFRDYVYIPLGGNRCTPARHIFNLTVVWLLTGLWHGAGWNFILWGMGTLVLLVLEKYTYGKFLEKFRIIGHCYMLIVIPLLWTIFNISDMSYLNLYLKKMFFIPLGGYEAHDTMTAFVYMLKKYWWMFATCAVFATPYPMRLFVKYKKTFICKLILFALFWLCVYEIVFGTSNPFLYFKF